MTRALLTITLPARTKTNTSTATSSTCSTASIPLPSATGSCPNVDLTCVPSGFSLDYYANPFFRHSFPDSGLGPGYYISENLTPLDSTTTSEIYFPQELVPTMQYPIVYPDQPYFVGYTRDIQGITVDGNNFTLVYSGLYRAPVSGTFTFCTLADNENAVFFGAGNAFPFGGKPSPNATPLQTGGVASGGNYQNPPSCFTYDLVIGQFFPIRFVMAGYQGPSALEFTIQPSGGTASYENPGVIYPASCAHATQL